MSRTTTARAHSPALRIARFAIPAPRYPGLNCRPPNSGHRSQASRRSCWKWLSILSRGGLQCRQVHLDHPHHGFHGFGVTDQLADVARHNLPAQAEAVCEPAAGHGFAAFDQLVPVAVDLLLGVAADEERDGGVELIRGAAVEKDNLLPLKLD